MFILSQLKTYVKFVSIWEKNFLESEKKLVLILRVLWLKEVNSLLCKYYVNVSCISY